MKRIRYTTAALLLGAFLTATPAMATAPVVSPTDTQVKEEQQAVTSQQSPDDTKKMAQEARKEIVARVNGADITMYDLVGMMNRVTQAYYKYVSEPTEEITNEIKQRAIDRLIFEELAVKEAQRQGIKPVSEKVEQVVLQLQEAYGSEEGYQKYLDDLGITEEQLIGRIARSHLLEGITGREVYQKLTPKEDIIKQVYNTYKEEGKLRAADQFRVKEILIMDSGDKEKNRQAADKLLVNLKAVNNDFGKLVLDGTFIVRDMRIKKDKYPVVFKQMQEMEVGQFSEVVEDGGTFHIFKVVQNDLARDLTEEESRKFIEDKLSYQFQEERRLEWIKELRKDAKIEILDEDLKNALIKKE
jgi:hypothetical protein